MMYYRLLRSLRTGSGAEEDKIMDTSFVNYPL